MTRTEAQAIANKNNLGTVWFQFNIAKNTGREFEVGYVSPDGKGRQLFCKRGSNSGVNQFYLCNEFRKLDGTE